MPKCAANADDRPRFDFSQSFKCMSRIFPDGEMASIPFGAFAVFPTGNQMLRMLTSNEIRRARLNMLIKDSGGLANLAQRLGYARTEVAKLGRIANANVRHERGGKPYNMGDPMARDIEERLGLDRGWMDNPPNYTELHTDEHISTALRAMERLPEPLRMKAAAFVEGLVEGSLQGEPGQQGDDRKAA